jgi:hypothetical protein
MAQLDGPRAHLKPAGLIFSGIRAQGYASFSASLLTKNLSCLTA